MNNYFATTDVCLVTIGTYKIDTADEFKIDPVSEEGSKQDLINKGRLLANKENPTILKGYDIALKDAVLRPKLMQILQGGTYTDGELFSYDAPTVGAIAPVKIPEVCIYTEVVEVGGATGEYIKTTFTDCLGDLVNFGFKDGEYFANEFKLKCRPTTGKKAYKMEMVAELPTTA